MPFTRGDRERQQQTYEKPVANNPAKRGGLFRTRRGNLLLYEPHALDRWIGQDIQGDECSRDATTGKLVSKKLVASYEAFYNRHLRRCRTGDKADKYIRLVDRYLPRVFAEARIYVARFPEQVGELRRQVKKVRRRIGKERGTRRNKQAVAQRVPPAGGAALRDDPPGEERQRSHKTNMGKRRAVKTQLVGERSSLTPTHHPTGGGVQTTRLCRCWGITGAGGSSVAPQIVETAHATWHRGLANQGEVRCPMNDDETYLLQTTDGGRILLVPNLLWRGVQQVQEHMARCRAMREASRS